MEDERRYYVYGYIRLDTNSYFYIGKGTGIRYKRIDLRSNHFKNIINKVDCVVEIIKDNLTEKEALELECELIQQLVFEEGYTMEFDDYKDKNKTYTDICQIEDYLLNFQNFASWLDEQLKKCPFKEWYIDKDILEKGNKIYDRQHMVLVDRRLNNLFTKSEAIRGEYPIGVNYHKLKMCFEVSCSVYEDNKKKNIYLGRFSINEPFRAFTCYKNFKEKYIKQVADEYKDLIPKELYEAMYRYKVEITD